MNWARTRLRARVGGTYLLLVAAGAVVLLPFVWALWASFVRSDLDLSRFPLTPAAYGLDNYALMLGGDSQILRWWINSLTITGVVLAGNLLFNTMAGYALAKVSFPGRRVVFAIVVGTMMLPPQVLFEPLYTMLVQLGWLNTYQALIVPFLVNPFGVFLMRQFFVTLPAELEDAGQIDGLGRLGLFFRIALPVSAPAMGAQAILIFVWNWNTFVFPSVLATSREMFTLPVGIYQITHTAFTNHVAQSMAGVVLTTLPALIVFLIFQRRFIQTLAGTVK